METSKCGLTIGPSKGIVGLLDMSLSAYAYTRYNELLLTRVLQKEEGYVTCLNPACGAGQVHGGESAYIPLSHSMYF